MASDNERRARHYLLFRLFIVLLGFGLVTFYQVRLKSAFSTHAFRYLYGLLGFYLALGLGLLATHRRWRGRHSVIRWQVVCDFLIQSLLVWGTGGIFSLFIPLLFVTLVAATSVISARGAFILATLATVLLSAATLSYGAGLVPIAVPPADLRSVQESSGFVSSYLLGSILALYTVSSLGSRFSHGLRKMTGIQSEIIENIDEGLIAVDHAGRIVMLNREARALLEIGDDQATLRRYTLESLFPGDRHVSLREAFRESRKRRLETRLAPGGGKERHCAVKISTVKGDAGEVRYRIGLIADLRLQREMEAAARRIQKLEDLQVMALGIAHEIRNPLASIRGCVQELGRVVPLAGNAQRHMEIVRRESDRLDGILEDFLQFARPGPLDLVPLDLVTLVEDAAVLLRKRPEFGSRTLTVSFPPERPRIFGDRNRLIQVLLNLGLNAIDATTPETGKISIQVRKRRFVNLEAGGDGRDLVEGVEIELSDNGCGIKEADLKKIFTPFFTSKPRGSGLGLCIVNRIVREHLGILDAASVEGQGSAFRIWFPVMRSGKPGEELVAAAAREGAAQEDESELNIHA